MIGAIIGAAAGALTARIVEGPPPEPEPSSNLGSRFYYGNFSPNGISYAIYIPAGAVAGAVTGAIIGGITIKIPINGSIENYNRKKKKLGRYTVKYDGSPTY